MHSHAGSHSEAKLGSSLSISHLDQSSGAKMPSDDGETPKLNLPYGTSISTQTVNALKNSNQIFPYAATWPSNMEGLESLYDPARKIRSVASSLLLFVLHDTKCYTLHSTRRSAMTQFTP